MMESISSSFTTRRLPLLCLLLAAVVSIIWGCSQFADSIPCTTKRVYTQVELRALFPGQTVICGDTSYSEVNPAFAPKWHAYMGSVMSLLGMSPKWNERFDCNRFVLVKLAVINVRYLVDTWNVAKTADSPAAGEVWYFPDGGVVDPKTGFPPGHAVVVTIEGGKPTYRDIYSDRVVTLSLTERASMFLIKF